MSVDRHMQSHTKERRSLTAGECSMCGEAFTNAAKLVSHMRTIHGTIDKTYQCESCEYRGATHSALKAHMRAVHENVRKHRCEYCEFTSFASSALKRHILAIHEKRKPFECDKVNMIQIIWGFLRFNFILSKYVLNFLFIYFSVHSKVPIKNLWSFIWLINTRMRVFLSIFKLRL